MVSQKSIFSVAFQTHPQTPAMELTMKTQGILEHWGAYLWTQRLKRNNIYFFREGMIIKTTDKLKTSQLG